MVKKKTYLCTMLRVKILFLCLSLAVTAFAQNPKREFRGAWIQCVNNQWKGMPTAQMQQTLLYQLDELQKCGINVILFQVRPEFDALYASKMEPWSRYLTGRQGVPPTPYWDPLEWMVEECHRRDMECHAWINPFRAKTKGTTELASTHICRAYPNNYFEYDGQYIFDPGIPGNRTYICRIAGDIVRRYDVDGLHIDDYFYPYPAAGQTIKDDYAYYNFGRGQNRDDWRRDNVNRFIKELSDTIHKNKPYCKFGVSPFGIYRNQSSDPKGSRTNGLQNYDQLYADVLLWVKKGWIDYNVPQIYWEIGNKAADYDELVRWWNDNAKERPLVIGQDVERTVKYADVNNPGQHQMDAKYTLQRQMKNVAGSCQWYAKAVVDNVGSYASVLRSKWHSTPALQPLMPWLGKGKPGKVRKMAVIETGRGPVLCWTAPRKGAHKYVVYCFRKGQKQNLESTENIVAITGNTFFELPKGQGGDKFTYVVTALDRLHNESKGKKKSVNL